MAGKPLGGAGRDGTRGDDEDFDKEGGTVTRIVGFFFFSTDHRFAAIKTETDIMLPQGH